MVQRNPDAISSGFSLFVVFRLNIISLPSNNLKMEYRKLSTLHKLPNNPRTIKDEGFKKLCTSVKTNKKLFEARPLILSDRTGKLVVIAGNQRYEAAKFNKMESVPTYLMKGLSIEQEREIIIRDNITNGEWDWKLLAKWDNKKLMDWGFNASIFKNNSPTAENNAILSDQVFMLNIECKNEKHCQELYERFLKEKLTVKIIS